MVVAGRSEQTAQTVAGAFHARRFRVYHTDDIIGAELGGALKNIIAIACGVVDGLEMGLNARAALMTRGFAEMSRLGTAMGARGDTLIGLSGFGDLALTCTSALSRNYRHGIDLGKTDGEETSVTVEGVASAKAVGLLARKLEIDMPISQVVAALCAGELTVEAALEALYARPLKEE